MTFRFPAWILAASAFVVPLVWAAFTAHAWEDYFITLRSSRNLVEGHGLVFNPGERVHTFTSPLGVLVPALCTWIAGAQQEQLALWLFRMLNAVALAAAALLVWRRAGTLNIGAVGRATFFGLMLLDSKLVDFATNGMETALLVFFVVYLWSELEAPGGPRALHLAVSCAGLLWTRPDAFILAGALGLPHLLIRARGAAAKSIPWRAYLGGALLAGAFYLPWFAWAWWYYGSPIPHTVVAKSHITPPVDLWALLSIPWRTLKGDSLLGDLFMPTYWFFGGWPAQLRYLGYALSLIGAFAWLVPSLSAAARRVSLAVFFGMFYVCAIVLFPWYSPPWMILAALAVAFTFDQVAGFAVRTHRAWLAVTIRLAAMLVIGIQGAVLAAAAWQMRQQQQLIEHGVRRDIGQWLAANASPTETVFLEPLGYIGYYSRLKTYDYPGLSSPEVASVIRAGKRRLTEVIGELHPTWLVLRPHEVADPNRPENAIWKEYALACVWDARPQLDAVRFLPGRGWLEHDAQFRVYRREDQGAARR